MQIRLISLIVILVTLSPLTPSTAQTDNLLKNPGGDEGTQYWRAFGDAKVEPCHPGGRCFILRNGGYFTQDVVIPPHAVSQYALFIGHAFGERKNTDGSITGLPSLAGYMMNSGDPSGGRIYAYLNGQQMRASVHSVGSWTQLWGVFRVKPGTRRIRFFLNQPVQANLVPEGAEQSGRTLRPKKNFPQNGMEVSFDDLGLYTFPTEQEARAFVSQRVPGVQFQATVSVIPSPGCKFSRATIPALYGIQLGMSLEEVVSLFPGSEGEPKVRHALEFSKSTNGASPISVLIENRTSIKDLSEGLRLFFRFHNRRLFEFIIDYQSPKWINADEFIDKRGELLNLSSADSWEPVEGNARFSKYLICDGVEIRFYAAPEGSPNPNIISVTDTTAERNTYQSS